MPLPPPSEEAIKRVVDAWLACDCKRIEAQEMLGGMPSTTFSNYLQRAKKMGLIGSTDSVGGHSGMTGVESLKDRLHLQIDSGTVMIGSDCHYWPG